MEIKKVPWIVSDAVSFIEENIKPTDSVFEYGSGGSTLWFAKKAQSVISVEHDKGWATKISSCAQENVKVLFIPPDEKLDKNYLSEAIKGKSFKSYASSIDCFSQFDWIIIDGRTRVWCAKHALCKIKKFIVLDDSDRSYYSEVHEIMKGFKRRVFSGDLATRPNGMYNETTIWEME